MEKKKSSLKSILGAGSAANEVPKFRVTNTKTLFSCYNFINSRK